MIGTAAALATLQFLGNYVAEMAIRAVQWALAYLDYGFTPVVQNNSWFGGQYDMMVTLGIWVMLPMVMIAVIHAIAKGSMQLLLRATLVYLPLAILGTAVAVYFVQLLLAVTDELSRSFTSPFKDEAERLYKALAVGADERSMAMGPGFTILMIVIFIALAIAAFAVFLVLLLREASIYVATLFLPLGFALLVWPATAKYFTKMIELLIALIFSKLVMVAAIGLGMAALGNAWGHDYSSVRFGSNGDLLGDLSTATAGLSTEKFWTWFNAASVAVVLFGVAAFAPHSFMRFMGGFALGSAGNALGAALDRPRATPWVIGLDRGVGITKSAGMLAKDPAENHAARKSMKNTSIESERLKLMGVEETRSGSRYAYELSHQALAANNIHDVGVQNQLIALSKSSNANHVAAAHLASAMGSDFRGIDFGNGATTVYGVNAAGQTTAQLFLNIHNAKGQPIKMHDASLARRAMTNAVNNTTGEVRFISNLGISNKERANATAINKGAHDINQQLARKGGAKRVVVSGSMPADIGVRARTNLNPA